MTDPLALTFIPSDEAVDSAVGEETVILHLGRGTYYGLDPLGTRIWAMIKDGLQPAAIRDAILAEFAVEPRVVEADLRAFLSDLLANDILVADPD